MAGLIPFNRKNNSLARTDTGFEDFYNMLDDFFNDSWLPGRSLMRDTFKIDIEETDKEYQIEAELPGVKKEELDLGIEGDNISITVNRSEEVNKDEKNYIHRERRSATMSRRVRLANAKLDEAKAKLEDGVLTITIPKDEQAINSRKINIE
jgi:HSP20 family protein